MIESASFRVCTIDYKPVKESEIFRDLVNEVGIRKAIKWTERITVNFEEIRRNGSAELNQVVDIIGYTPLNQRSDAS